MDKRQILILLKIGNMDVSNKCITSVSVDRNFSDIGDKFSIDIVDSPDTTVANDLELYMAAGYRSMTLRYGDISENELVTYNGTIWDYTNTFVGNMKTLTITGIMNRYVTSTVGAGSYTYNIDWNSYFNKRADEHKLYGAIDALLYNTKLVKAYTQYTNTTTRHYDENGWYTGTTKDTESFMSSAILNPEYKTKILGNTDESTSIKITGPSGKSIYLPIPDSFFSISAGEVPPNIEEWMITKDTSYTKFYDIIEDPNNQFWGPLTIQGITNTTFTDNKYAQMPNFYLAEELFIRNYTKDGYDEATGYVKYVTKEVLTDTHCIRFHNEAQTNQYGNYGFTVVSPWFVKEQFLPMACPRGREYVGGRDSLLYCSDSNGSRKKLFDFNATTQDDHSQNWYNGGNKACYKGFYKKINVSNWIMNQVLDDSNTIDYVTNDNGQVFAFRHHRKGLDEDEVDTYVAVSKEDLERIVANSKMDIRTYSHYFEIGSSIFGDSGTAWYKFDTKGSAKMKSLDGTGNYYFYDQGQYSEDKMPCLRAFLVSDAIGSTTGNLYVQANPNSLKSIYGAAGIVNSGIGVDISEIVKKLATLEGWDWDDSTIMQTELVPNSDNFIMQNQTAMEFILNNLVPKAVTPLGRYSLKDVDNYEEAKMLLAGRGIDIGPNTGEWVESETKIIDKPMGGFYPFFDENGKFHFQPLTKENIKELKIPELGYNIPNTPMISFQINTKGTNFYVNPNVDYSPMSIVTGKQFTDLEVMSEAVANQIEATRGHNDTFDAWLGLTYEQVEKEAPENATGEQKYQIALKLAPNALVTKPSAFLAGSAEMDAASVRSRIIEAKDKIGKVVIQATLSMWGNTKVAPARTITVTNMLKGGPNNSYNPVMHSSSGKYLIIRVQDKIDANGFIQNLDLQRYTEDVEAGINPENIDYSKGASYVYNGEVENIMKNDGTPNDLTNYLINSWSGAANFFGN